jgi:3',5'-cyclic AMP phosphodiesterase CpdA
MFTIAHLSDLHVTPVRVDGVRSLLNKRALGWLSWTVRRRHTYRPEVLDALLGDLADEAPDHVVVTGDLTNVAGESEFEGARLWLERIGGPERVSIVPGNHDAYVPVRPERGIGRWAAWLRSDRGERPDRFPTLRVRGPLAIVGLCSARPTAPFLASGSLGPEQLERFEKTLEGLAEGPLFRLVLVHHPITEGAVSRRRALGDADALRDVLARFGADLVLHGHAHRTLVASVPGPEGPIPVVGVRSSSYDGGKPHKRAQYHLYDVEPAEGAGRFRIGLRVRGYERAAGTFDAEGEQAL